MPLYFDCNVHAPVHFKGCNYEIVLHAVRLFSYRSQSSVSWRVKALHFATGGQYASTGLWSVSSGQIAHLTDDVQDDGLSQLDGSLSMMAKI